MRPRRARRTGRPPGDAARIAQEIFDGQVRKRILVEPSGQEMFATQYAILLPVYDLRNGMYKINPE
jgi:hypothetical protein